MKKRILSPEALRKLRRGVWPRGIVQTFTVNSPDSSLRSNARELVPLDRMAARVVSKGEHWDRRISKKGGKVWTVCPKFKRLPHDVVDITGLRRGRMKIVGYFGRSKSGRTGQKWIARCDCGRFEVRNATAFKRGLETGHGDACRYCRQEIAIKRHDRWREQGADPARKLDTELSVGNSTIGERGLRRQRARLRKNGEQ